jgi:hypothetical protein
MSGTALLDPDQDDSWSPHVDETATRADRDLPLRRVNPGSRQTGRDF